MRNMKRNWRWMQTTYALLFLLWMPVSNAQQPGAVNPWAFDKYKQAPYGGLRPWANQPPQQHPAQPYRPYYDYPYYPAPPPYYGFQGSPYMGGYPSYHPDLLYQGLMPLGLPGYGPSGYGLPGYGMPYGYW